MIDTTHDLTSHDEMLHKTGEALRVLLADQQTQQSSVDALREIARRQEEDLATHQQRRASLLEALRTAQLASNKAQAARDLAAGGKTAKKREAAYEQAVSAVSAIQHELLALAGADDQLRGEQASTLATLADAQENLQRIVERVSIAQSIHDEELTAHREEIRQSWMQKLESARQQRDRLKSQVVDADLTVQQIQAGMVEALRGWPEYAREVLGEALEIADDEGTEIIQRHLDYSGYLESHAGSFDPRLAQLLARGTPDALYLKNYGSRATQRGGLSSAQLLAQGKGRGISPDLWAYDDAQTELQRVCGQSRAEHRRRIIEALLGNQEEADQHLGWGETNRTIADIHSH